MGTFIIDMIEDVIVTILIENFSGRKSGNLFRMVVPEGNLAVGIHEVHPFLHILQDLLVDQSLFHYT
jgi:hypothetical protein